MSLLRMFLLAALALLPLHSQQLVTIEGTVRDPQGLTVAGAVIDVYGPARRTARSGPSGGYRVEALPAGHYRVTAVSDGLALRELEREFTAASSLDFHLDLAPAASIIETASKTREDSLRVPFLVTSVSRSELRDTATASFDEALRAIAGLQHATQGNFFTRVTTRGLRDTADVLTLVDGVPLRQLNGSADLAMIPVTALQGVEFVKGSASSMYGRSAIGGAMQFYTVPAAGPKLAGDLAFTRASFGTNEGQGGIHIPTRRGRLAAAGVISRSEGFQQGTGRDQNFLTVSADHAFSPYLNLRLSYLGSGVRAGRGSIVPLANGRPIFGITRRDNFGIPGVYIDGELHSASAKVDSQLSSRVLLSNSFNFNRYNRLFQGGITIVPPPAAVTKGYSENFTRQDSYLNETLLQWDAGSASRRNTFTAGLTFDWGNFDQASPVFAAAPTYRGPDYNRPVTNTGNDPRGTRGPSVTSYFRQNVVSFFAQHHFVWRRLGVLAGLRTDSFDQQLTRSDTPVRAPFSASRFSPRIGGDFALLRRESVSLVGFGNFAEGFRPQLPGLNTLNNVVVPQLLRPEVTRNIEGGLRVRHRAVSAQASFFNMRKIDGQRSFRSGPEDFIFVNATSRVRGFESELRALLPAGVSAYGNYAFHNAKHIEFRPTAATNFSGNRLRMSPQHIAGSGLAWAWRRVVWNGGVAYVGARPLRDNVVVSQVLPSYTLLNTSLSIRLGPVQTVFSATNLTDRYYIADDFSAQDAGNPGLPRRFSVQLRYRF
ncbi:MAG: TonB-dependent receptor [Acidobacteria bacterium]|nr:TonB-dependent receptor [Acidobacteriota bacterium]